MDALIGLFEMGQAPIFVGVRNVSEMLDHSTWRARRKISAAERIDRLAIVAEQCRVSHSRLITAAILNTHTDCEPRAATIDTADMALVYVSEPNVSNPSVAFSIFAPDFIFEWQSRVEDNFSECEILLKESDREYPVADDELKKFAASAMDKELLAWTRGDQPWNT